MGEWALDARNIHQMFYGFAVASLPLLLVSQHPAMFLAVGSFSVVSIMGGNVVRIVRIQAELGVEPVLGSSVIEDPAAEALRRVVTVDVLKAVGSVELVGRRLRHELKSSEEPVLDPEAQRQLTAWLDSASRDLAQARAKVNELTAGAS